MPLKGKKNYEVKAWLAPVLYFGLKNKGFEFIENISYFLSSGMTILDALNSLEDEIGSFRMKKLISKIKDDIENGLSLADSLSRHKFFNSGTIEIIRAGELSGKLVENLKLIVVLNDEDRKLKSKLNSSLLYGTIIIVVTIIVGVGTAWFVLPKIASVYGEMGASLPLLTQWLMKVGLVFSKYGYIIFPSFALFIATVLYFLFSFPKTKFIGHLILFYIPFLNKLIKESETTRFGYLLGNIIEAGLPINKAFEVMPGTTTFNNYKKLYKFLNQKVLEGVSISEALKAYKHTKKLFPAGVLQMINSAEKSGKLSETFIRISNLYESKLESTSRNIPIIVEPVLLILIGLCVAVFVMATIMPVYNLTEIIK